MRKRSSLEALTIAYRPSSIVFLLLLLIWPVVSRAGTTGKIAGRVTLADTGEPLPGAQVVIEGTMQGTVSDADGYYTIINVKPGTYVVVFKFIGFADMRVENVKVIVDKTTTINVEMQEQVYEGEEVIVIAERPLVQIDRTTTTSFVDGEQIEALPVTGIGEVVNLQAGVVDGHFRGGRTGEVAYLVNGVPINNPFNNSAAFEVEKNMVAGLEVISGVFNAEYGQALSGVVNIVTKDVPREWTGSASFEMGGIASTRKLEYVRRTADAGAGLRISDFQTEEVSYSKASGIPGCGLFGDIGRFQIGHDLGAGETVSGRCDAQVSIGGPIIRDRLGIRLTGRYYQDSGHVIGRRLFAPSDSSAGLTSGNPGAWFIESTGDQEFVPSYNKRLSLNSTVVYRLTPMVKLEYNLMLQDGTGRNTDHQRKYVPDGINRYFNNSQFHLLGVHLTLGSRSFANINYSYLRDTGSSQLYDIPEGFDAESLGPDGILDGRYVSDRLATLDGPNAFDVGGNDLFNGGSLTETHTILADYTNQLSRVHEVKIGASARLHHLDNGNYGIEIGPRTQYQPRVAVDIWGRDTLQTRPYELAAYAQDKMEFRDASLIVNAGLRFDYFSPDYQIPVDWTQASLLRIPAYDESGNPTGDSLSNRQKGPARWQLSPRIGIAFPISATGVIRFSAGLFFQIPQFSLVYTNPNFETNPRGDSNFGNPALDPERTLHFEIGLQQGITDALGLELTLFSKDIRNLTGVQIRRDVLTTYFFVRYINRDVGTSRGLTLSLFQRPVGPLSWDIDYTLQFAKGTSSNPREAFDRFQSGQEDVLTLVRLDWDRRHVLTNSITLSPNRTFSLTLINRLQSGAPYTTVRNFVTSYIENNADRPFSSTSDLRVFYRPTFFRGVSITMQVDNVFDAKVHYGVYSDTGRGDESVTLEQFRRTGAQVGGINSLDEYYFNQGWFSAPRRITLGVSYRF